MTGHTYKILVVDDDRDNLKIIMDFLKQSNPDYQLFQASNGAIALKVVEKESPDLILLDWVMPVMDGMEALKNLKSNPATRDIPVIMQTGESEDIKLKEAFEEGVLDYIKKPIRALELNARVRSAMTLNQAHRALKQSHQEISQKNEAITASIQYAERIQKASMQKSKSILDALDAFVLFLPRDIVSGDFFWAAKAISRSSSTIREENAPPEASRALTLLAAIDCTGHGVPGAFMTMLGRAFLDTIVNEYRVTEPGEILKLLDQRIRDTLEQRGEGTNQDGMDMALISLDQEQQILKYAGAKNPLLYIEQGELKQIKASPHAIGGSRMKQAKEFATHSLSLEALEAVYLFSDGFPDQFGGPSDTKFMKKNFKQLLQANYQLPILAQQQALEKAILDWKGDRSQTDDILVIGLKP